MAIKEKVLKEDEWLRFIEKERKDKTIVVGVFSKCSKVELGEIRWYPQWRYYCFFPYEDIEAVYSDRCEFAIYDFIKELNIKHKTLAEVGKVIDGMDAEDFKRIKFKRPYYKGKEELKQKLGIEVLK